MKGKQTSLKLAHGFNRGNKRDNQYSNGFNHLSVRPYHRAYPKPLKRLAINLGIFYPMVETMG